MERDPARQGVQFGDTVEIKREGQRSQTYRIVGEDEADPAAGAISYVSPLGPALLGREVGDVVEVAGREVEIVNLISGVTDDHRALSEEALERAQLSASGVRLWKERSE